MREWLKIPNQNLWDYGIKYEEGHDYREVILKESIGYVQKITPYPATQPTLIHWFYRIPSLGIRGYGSSLEHAQESIEKLVKEFNL